MRRPGTRFRASGTASITRRSSGAPTPEPPQELQIARLLADGKTPREAAAAVFLSPKTVEYHLRHVYRKLSIHSREELVAAFRDRR